MISGLDEVLVQLLAETPSVTAKDGQYAAGKVVFAVRSSPDQMDLLLGPEIGEAARRTPDTHASSRGDAWVSFAARSWDDHAADRLQAWFRVAWRRAADGG